MGRRQMGQQPVVPEDPQRGGAGPPGAGGGWVRTGQSGCKKFLKHLPAPLSGSPGISGACRLLTSASAVMLELVAVHSLFAVRPFPADTRRRGSLRLCSRDLRPGLRTRWALTQASPGMGNCDSHFRCSSCCGQRSGLTTTAGCWVCFQVWVFQRPGRALGPASAGGRGPWGCLLALWLHCGPAWEGPPTGLQSRIWANHRRQ